MIHTKMNMKEVIMLRKSKGNMYDFITHTYNPIRGKCGYDCSYCYMKRFKQNPLRIHAKDLQYDIGNNKNIFVCSGTDLFSPDVPIEWVEIVLNKLLNHNNTYLLQTKNPMRMAYYSKPLAKKTIFCTTLESDKIYPEIIGKAPNINMRYAGIKAIKSLGFRIMVTIEPILDFDVINFSSMLISLKPEQVNIGADSKNNNLPEPQKDKVRRLIINLERQGIKVYQKSNLERILN